MRLSIGYQLVALGSTSVKPESQVAVTWLYCDYQVKTRVTPGVPTAALRAKIAP